MAPDAKQHNQYISGRQSIIHIYSMLYNRSIPHLLSAKYSKGHILIFLQAMDLTIANVGLDFIKNICSLIKRPADNQLTTWY